MCVCSGHLICTSESGVRGVFVGQFLRTVTAGVTIGAGVTAEDDASPHRKVKDLSRLQADVLSLRTEAAELQARVRVMVRVRV